VEVEKSNIESLFLEGNHILLREGEKKVSNKFDVSRETASQIFLSPTLYECLVPPKM